MARARLLIVNDQYRVIRGLSLLMALEDSAEVVGWATDATQAVERTRELLPDVVLLDHSLGGADGVDVAVRIHDTHPDARVIISSVYEAGNDAERARRAGVEKWIPKNLPPGVLLEEVRAVARARQISQD